MIGRRTSPRTTVGALTAAAMLTLAGPTGFAQAEGLSDADRAEVEAIIHDYLMANPEVIIDALNAFQTREEARMHEEVEETLVNSKTSPILGNPDGDVTLVEFFDYQCGYCKTIADDLRRLIGDDDELRVVMKEFPVMGEGSVTAARAALAAHAQGAYEEMHFALMAHRGGFTEDIVLGIAEAQGLDPDKLYRDMAADWVIDEIEATLDLAWTMGIRGTPAFVVGTNIIPGAVELEVLAHAIAEARNQ